MTYKVQLLLNCGHTLYVIVEGTVLDFPQKGDQVHCKTCKENKPVFMRGEYFEIKEDKNENSN